MFVKKTGFGNYKFELVVEMVPGQEGTDYRGRIVGEDA